MARIRSIKPEFWKNEQLGEMPCEAQLLFIGLWNLCDKRGFLEDRPKRIKAELFPYRIIDVDALLSILDGNFIRRIDVNGIKYIHVIKFTKHQVINIREPESTVPEQYWHSTGTVLESWEGKVRGVEMEGDGSTDNVPPTPILHNPMTTSNNSMLSFDETYKEFMSAEGWQQKFCMDHHLEQSFIVNDMKLFLEELDKSDQFPKKLSDTKFFYTKRLEKFLTKRTSEEKASQKRRSNVPTV